MAFQIFVSYARDDDIPPLGEKAGGFIDDLYANLKQEFRRLGPETPELWRDKRQIDPDDQFDPILEEAVRGSQLFIAVLSRNWVKRPYCLRELEWFVERWKSEGDQAVRKRVIVVGKHSLPFNERPLYLQGQEGFIFYEREGGRDPEPGREQELVDREYYDVVKRLAQRLWIRAQNQEAAPKPEPVAGATSKPDGTPEKSSRTIYLAKPAADMREAYLRLVDELTGRGYAVVPERDVEIPHDATALQFVDAALGEAELSIHLLGEKAGYEPTEDVDRIVKLQLARASRRVAALTGLAPDKGPAFRRIIWAPKVLVDQEGAAPAGGERDPLAVLAKFDPQLDSDDVEGSELSKFSEYVVQYLVKTTPRVETGIGPILEGGAQVYVYHREDDTAYAVELAKALKQRKLSPVLPAFEGSPVELSAYHKQRLREADAVVVCWANAAEVWALSQFPEFKNWQELGREKKFAVRALVAAPPPGVRKAVLIEVPPSNEVDVVLDLTHHEKPTPEDLDPLVSAAGASA